MQVRIDLSQYTFDLQFRSCHHALMCENSWLLLQDREGIRTGVGWNIMLGACRKGQEVKKSRTRSVKDGNALDLLSDSDL